MKLPYAEPDPAGSERALNAKKIRDLATEVSRLQPQASTKSNSEEADHSDMFPANFTKGLVHNKWGILDKPYHYRCFVEAINSSDRNLFEKSVPTFNDAIINGKEKYSCKIERDENHCLFEKIKEVDKPCTKKASPKVEPPCEKEKHKSCPDWRGWESPRCGHVYELEGPDAGTVAMSPAPRIGSDELSAEMAEVYSLALLRDIPFTEISGIGDKGNTTSKSSNSKKNRAKTFLSPEKIVALLNEMSFFNCKVEDEDCDPKKPPCNYSSTPCNKDKRGFNNFEHNRRYARTLSDDGELTQKNVFRGSTKGAHNGPYISQFLLIGTESIAGCRSNSNDSKYDCNSENNAKSNLADGYIPYGSQVIDQRTNTHTRCLDYMTNWPSWLDVQNGADVGSAEQFESKRRFITTPRDLATYVHHDALYQAYLNACLILLAKKIPHSKGFPEPSASGVRTDFATFGGPHILSLVTEVATRCLKAVRRQKFNYHRRGRPEALGGRLTLLRLNKGCKIGKAEAAYEKTFNEIPYGLRKAIQTHNENQNKRADRKIFCQKKRSDKSIMNAPDDSITEQDFINNNLLLPMAFPEGSPMHPSYGAGHATVAGGCVTMLKAFFEMYEDHDSGVERKLVDACDNAFAFVPEVDGSALIDMFSTDRFDPNKLDFTHLTIQGELDKLAANISIGRNMAGVHFYSDYYDSLRMGERIAVGILIQQSPTYGDYMEVSFKSFDEDMITISGEAGSCPSLSIMDEDGKPVTPDDWWLRHVVGKEISEDLVI